VQAAGEVSHRPELIRYVQGMTGGEKGRTGTWLGMVIGFALGVGLSALWGWEDPAAVWQFVGVMVVVFAGFGLGTALEARRKRRPPN
jgi:hypothetical protein